jgi:hypothetical protein
MVSRSERYKAPQVPFVSPIMRFVDFDRGARMNSGYWRQGRRDLLGSSDDGEVPFADQLADFDSAPDSKFLVFQ